MIFRSLLLALLVAAPTEVIVNSPTPNATTIHIPDHVRNEVTVCVDDEWREGWHCETVAELRRQLRSRRDAQALPFEGLDGSALHTNR